MGKKILLLGNLGSPNTPTTEDVRRYLDEFLMDERVIDIPFLLRYILVKGIIVPFRAPKSAKKYKTIWTKAGSPLITITNQLAALVQEKTSMPVYVCMRYANPTPKFSLDAIQREHPDAEEVIFLPLYPHYAMSSYETAVEHVKANHEQGSYSFKLSVIKPYYKDEKYIHALAESIRPFLKEKYDHILFSYHGIPVRHLKKTDSTKKHCITCDNCCNTASEAHEVCYRHQVKVTTELVAQKLGIKENEFSLSFQSRLGSDKWLQPYTAEQLKQFPQKGIKNLLVVSPAFVSDCLETLEEIHVEGKEEFEESGGEHFVTVPCLNTDTLWIEAIDHLIKKHLS
ncbi:ferrochelatase [Sediminibacterium sp. C3]|uniref:ferrochelatase n=1 Tax=Sediminibacterium sp. C3 TaxID=1267211 RepID=UPI00041408E8|nr:ferrochelatase [Sediminibacterium sp. C3]